ncbi:MAG: discoidin domain-containing protein [Ignavibacteria bacterium]
MRKILIGILLCFSFCRLAAQEDSIMHNGFNRVYLLYVPPNYDSSAPYSLIILLHGASGTETSLYNSGFNERAGIMKYIAVYPRGINRNWNGPDNDVDFISDLIDTLKSEYNIDTNRIYAAGQSAGAYFCYRLGCSLPDKIAAIAPLAGAASCVITSPVPLCAIHALDDQTVSYNSHKFSLTAWRELNQCTGTPDTIYNLNGVVGELWRADESGADVAFYTYFHGGHSWLNSPVSCVDFIADFFYSHPKRKVPVILMSPLNTIFNTPCSIDLTAAVETGTPVTKVEYFADSIKIGESSTPPYSFIWEDVSPNEYLIYAKALLADGTSEISSNIKQILVMLPNAALLKPAESSANESSLYPAQNAFDGNLSTRWSTPFSDPQWISVDLQGIYLINGAALFWETACGLEYTIDVSTDEQYWETVYTTASGRGGTEYIFISPVEARYIRMHGNRRATQYGYSLWEFQVHGTEITSVSNSTSINFKLNMNVFPNPFNSETIIRYTLPEDGIVEANIYNIGGQKVRSLIQTQEKAGGHILHWDGRDDSGYSVTSGVYICRISSGDRAAARKLLLLK